jgi:hypothetical protein
MKDPLEALAAARRVAAATEGDDAVTAGPVDNAKAGAAAARRLVEWAIIEPEQAEVVSTRRLGRPITAVKLLLVRLLRQYLGEMSAQQSRFNAHVAAHVLRLEERVAELEQAADRRDGDAPPPG